MFDLTPEKMPKKFDNVWTDKIVAMAKEGHSLRDIHRSLQRSGVHMSRQSVWYYAKGHQKTRCVIPTKSTPEVRNLVDEITRENDDLCAAQIKIILKTRHSIEISESSIRNIRRQLACTFRPSRLCPMMKDVKKKKWVAKAWMERTDNTSEAAESTEDPLVEESGNKGEQVDMSAHERMSIQVETLITQVQAYPALWDTSHPAYRDRQSKDEAWNHICRFMFPNWDGITVKEQALIDYNLRNRWRSVRDRFRKDDSIRESNGGCPANHKPYAYYNMLLFMKTPKLPPSEKSIKTIKRSLEESEDVFEITSFDSDSTSEFEYDGPPIEPSTSQPRPRRAAAPIRFSQKIPRKRSTVAYQLDSDTVALLKRVGSEDESDSFGRVIAEEIRRLPQERRARFMSYILGCVDLFAKPADSLDVQGILASLQVTIGGLPPLPSTPSKTNVVSNTHHRRPPTYAGVSATSETYIPTAPSYVNLFIASSQTGNNPNSAYFNPSTSGQSSSGSTSSCPFSTQHYTNHS